MNVPPFRQYTGNGQPAPGKATLNRRPDQRGHYLASPELALAVNTALAVEQPLLLTGEPGTGKTELAWSIASELGLARVLEFHTRSDSEATDLLYRFDNVRRFADANQKGLSELEKYVSMGPLGAALESTTRELVLIDEIDKAPRDFPNDLLNVIDQMEFTVRETGRRVPAPGTRSQRPIVIITSNVERQLPDPFLRRCVYHHIEPPTTKQLHDILGQRLGVKVEHALVTSAVKRYEAVRSQTLRKPPATQELIAWVQVLMRAGVDPKAVADTPLSELFPGALIKTHEDNKTLATSPAGRGG